MVKMPQSLCSSAGLSLHPHGFFNECTIIIELLTFNFSYYVVTGTCQHVWRTGYLLFAAVTCFHLICSYDYSCYH